MFKTACVLTSAPGPMLFGQEGTANTSDPNTPDTTILIIALICGSASAFIALISGLNIAKQVETVALEYVMTRYRFMVHYVLCRLQLIRCMYVCLIVLCEFEMISILCFIIIWLFLLFILFERCVQPQMLQLCYQGWHLLCLEGWWSCRFRCMSSQELRSCTFPVDIVRSHLYVQVVRIRKQKEQAAVRIRKTWTSEKFLLRPGPDFKKI